jgi:hypothetical protein
MELALPGYAMLVSVIASLLLVHGMATCCWAQSSDSPLAVGFGTCCASANALAGTSSNSSITDHPSDCLDRCFEGTPRDIITEAPATLEVEKKTVRSDRCAKAVSRTELSRRAARLDIVETFSVQGSDLALRNCSLLA